MPRNKKTLKQIFNIYDYKINNKTLHMSERLERLSHYKLGKRVHGFLVDTFHPNGYEIHIVDTKGFILIFNERTQRFITILSGREAQITMYYEHLNLPIPDIILKAIEVAKKRNEKENANNL